ncbi:MAG: hypothetical protein L6R38_005506 [Xanthoria sp. 2 TBL-2021]|nr:MAG: hypothetical protein L6R38_005506 [Xanthoria sp. 2 TBL-2021]
MEQSPLIVAQTHARNAATAPNPAAAALEHEQAAGQFAAAAKGTTNLEAARTLKLLEQHHQKLADLIKFRTAHPIPPNTSNTAEQQLQGHADSPAPQQPREGSPYRSQSHVVPLPQRDISSSIASNLASARGIPSNRQKRSQQSPLAPQTAKPEAPNPQRRSKLIEGTYQNRSPQPQKSQRTASTDSNSTTASLLSTSNLQNYPPPTEPAPPKSDEPFQRFYSTFESLFSKLSAPLAFAGLPLNPDTDPSTPTPPSSTVDSSKPLASQKDRLATNPPKPSSSSRRALEASQRVSADPDYKNLFSRAALRAVADEHGPGSVGANESFYVVPTSGHTLAYADILARQHRERRRDHDAQTRRSGDNSDDGEFDGDEELFVDARETPGPPSPEMNRRRGKGKAAANIGTKTMEELQLENEAMKALLDQTSRRLLEFEMSAQTSSVALARSIRQLNMHNNEGNGAGNSGGGNGNGSKEAEEKMRAMEEQMLARVKEMAKVERENEKLKGVVGRYRERFETIKAGARARRDERGKSGEEV